MLKKLSFFKEKYLSGVFCISVQENKRLLEDTRKLIEKYFEKNQLAYTLINNYKGNGVNEGRSSFSFRVATSSNYERFIKTNYPGMSNKDILYREYKIMSKLYPDIGILFHDISKESAAIEMPFFERLASKLSFDDAKRLWTDTCGSLNKLEWENEGLYSILDILCVAYDELDFLNSKHLIEDKQASLIKECFVIVQEYFSKCQKTICHGDYGDANILIFNDKMVVIDWEDCFMGVDDYDMFYWLSFFSHRKYYTEDLFGVNEGEKAKNMGIMLMILVIKEAMAVYNGEYLKNSMTAQDRISEIIGYL